MSENSMWRCKLWKPRAASSPDDPRLADLDARIATLRAELGPAQIEAAINAKNFDRALQLLDEAARAKSLGRRQVESIA